MKIILFGLRRSGTTLAFNIFRRNNNLLCFHEPLHPNLISKDRVSCLINDKKGVYSEYNTIYKDLEKKHEGFGAPRYDIIEELITNNLTNRHIDYLDFLFKCAENVLIQPVRLNYQLYQLLTHFPQAKFVWIVRQPDGFISSVLNYRPSLLTYHDACLAGSRAINTCRKNFLFRIIRGWNAFENPWSQIAAANFIVQSRPYFRDLITAPTYIKLLALWYDHYRFVTEFIKSNPQICYIFNYEKICRSEDYVSKLMAELHINYPADHFDDFINSEVIEKHKRSKIDISDAEVMIQDKIRESGMNLDISYRNLIG